MKLGARILGVAAAVAVTVPLAACVGASDSLPTVAVETITAPASLTPAQPLVQQRGDLMPATDSAPFAFGGAVTEPGGVASPAVWTSSDGASWQRATVGADVDGSFWGMLAGSDELAALGGVVWKERSYTSVLWTSVDRITWQAVALPEPFVSTHRLTLLDVIDDLVYGIAQTTLGAAEAFVASGSSVDTIALPELREGEVLTPLALTGHDDSLLLIATPGPEGQYNPVVSYRSTDRGASWSSAVELGASITDFAGVTWTGTEYVATGSTPGSSTPGAAYRPSSWVSADGATWAKEAVPAPPRSSPFFFLDGADVWFGAPTVNNGTVTVIASNLNSAVGALYSRSASGAWTFVSTTSTNSTNGENGLAVPHADGDAVVVLGSGGHLRTGAFDGDEFTDTQTLAARDVVGYVHGAHPAVDAVDLVVRQRTFTVETDLRWRNTSDYTLATYAGGQAASETPWSPAEVGELLTVSMATDADGAQIVTGSRFPVGESVIIAEGYYRASATADWVPMTGFSRKGSTEFHALASTGGGWVAVGDYRASSNTGTPSHATVWTSTDGVAWVRADGDFGEGRLESSLADVCVLPDGTPIGVGWAAVGTGAYRMAAWSPAGDAWAHHDLGEFGDADGYATSCANDETGVVVSASIAGRSVLLRTTTGGDWRQVFRAEQGAVLVDPIAVDGGFAAAGSFADEATAGAVVWLSRDGIAWVPVSIPSRNPDSTYLVAPVGADLLVALPATSGDPLVVVRDIARVIADLAPTSTT